MCKKTQIVLALVGVVLSSIGCMAIRSRQDTKAKVPSQVPPMTSDPFAPCDIDRDGDCDVDDYNMIVHLIGETIGGSRYNELADADHDGLISKDDLRRLFPTMPEQ